MKIPNPARSRPKRVAVIGAGHYHATLAPFYLKILQDEKLDIVGVHDSDRAVAEDRAQRCGRPKRSRHEYADITPRIANTAVEAPTA